MSSRNEGQIAFVIRYPLFPVVVRMGAGLHAATTPERLITVMEAPDVVSGLVEVQIIDSNADEFRFVSEVGLITPLFPPKKWTKGQISELYNQSHAAAEQRYQPTSLSNKRLPQIVPDVVRLLLRENR